MCKRGETRNKTKLVLIHGLTLPFTLRYRNKFAFLTTVNTVCPVRLVA
jgi:hypothetical protein